MFHGSLPEASNREDYPYIGQIIDDDTDGPIDPASQRLVLSVGQRYADRAKTQAPITSKTVFIAANLTRWAAFSMGI